MAETLESCENRADSRLKNLVNFSKGFDPRRVIPNNAGKKYKPSIRKLLRAVADVPCEELGLTAEQSAALSLMNDAMENEDPNVRRQALKEIWDRLYGRPDQTVNQKHSGVIQHEHYQIIARLATVEAKQAKAIHNPLELTVVHGFMLENGQFEEDKNGDAYLAKFNSLEISAQNGNDDESAPIESEP